MKNNQDNRPLGEKIDDGIDEVMGTVEDVLYGEKGNINEDIPATYYDGNGRRKVSKVLTQRNISRKIVKHGGLKILLRILYIGLIGFLIYELLYQFLMK